MSKFPCPHKLNRMTSSCICAYMSDHTYIPIQEYQSKCVELSACHWRIKIFCPHNLNRTTSFCQHGKRCIRLISRIDPFCMSVCVCVCTCVCVCVCVCVCACVSVYEYSYVCIKIAVPAQTILSLASSLLTHTHTPCTQP